ncbi:MAG: sensor histidine kinase [Myxococcaceae bacterium]
MKPLLQRAGVRVRLTFWYSAALVGVLGLYSLGLYGVLRGTLLSELDRQLREDIENTEEELTAFLAHNPEAVRGVSERDPWVSEVWSLQGQRVASSPLFDEGSPLPVPSAKCQARRLHYESAVLRDGLELRTVCHTTRADGRQLVVRTARSAARVGAELKRLGLIMGVGLPLSVLLAGFAGYLLAWRALLPVRRMTEQARRITAQRLSERLDAPNTRDELGQLALTFNEVFARLERSFEQMRRFTADASHELRTPLAAIRALGEVALNSPEETSGQREALSSILEEADSLRTLVDSLLTLSRADAGQYPLDLQPVKLSELARNVANQLEVLAEEKGQTLVVETDGDPTVAVDASLLRRALTNILDNAIQFGPAGSQIVLRVCLKNGSTARVEVMDDGPGVPLVHLAHVFERFYRVDPSRPRSRGGTGLGLAIARWAVEVHGGEIGVESNGLKGSVFFFSLPTVTSSAMPRSASAQL